MLRTVTGKQILELDGPSFEERRSHFLSVSIDVGTGDGRNIYRQAKSDPDTFYIGLDPAAENMSQIAQKARRKPEKGGLSNILFVAASAQDPPAELQGTADRLTVYFPWGALLEGVAHPDPPILEGMRRLCKNGASFRFVLTYSELYEAAEIKKRALPALSQDYFLSSYHDTLKQYGFDLQSVEILDNSFAAQFDSLWAKRLAFGRRRDFYVLDGILL